MNARKRILLALLVFVLAGCGGSIRVIPTPTPTLTVPTLTFTPPSTPTATATVTRAASPAATSAATAVRAITATPTRTLTVIPPPARINLKDVGQSVLRQSSHQFEIEIVSPKEDAIFLTGVWVREPNSILVRLQQQDIQAVEIAGRRWGAMKQDEWWPASLDDIKIDISPGVDPAKAKEFLPINHYLTMRLANDMISKATKLLNGLFEDQVASLSSASAVVDGVPSFEYTWRDQASDATWRIYLATSNNLLVKIVQMKGNTLIATYRFSHYNDPANVIRTPTSHLPDKLNIADARMALNGLASFQWSLSRAGKLGAKSMDMSVKGTYVQTTRAWQTFYWKNAEMRGAADLKFLGMDIRYWFDSGSGKQWSPISEQLQSAVV